MSAPRDPLALRLAGGPGRTAVPYGPERPFPRCDGVHAEREAEALARAVGWTTLRLATRGLARREFIVRVELCAECLAALGVTLAPVAGAATGGTGA